MERQTKIVLEAYNPSWNSTFEQLKLVYQACLQDLVLAIEHVGSTSVAGLIAKPILDIDLIVEDESTMEKVIEKLSSLGYQHQGDLGIVGREAFKRTSVTIPRVASKGEWPAHHLYACLNGCTSLRNHLLFRDYLRVHPAALEAYGQLKQHLASLYPTQIDRYVAGKTTFIATVLKQAGMSQAEIDRIREQNAVKG